MQIIEINDPSKKDSKESEIIVGIDFGTTHSLIAYQENSVNTKIIKDDNGRELIPSIITAYAHKDAVDFTIGDQSSNKNTIYSIKRLLAKSKDEIESNPVLADLAGFPLNEDGATVNVNIDGKLYNIALIAAQIFMYLKSMASKELQQEISKAVISTPAYFDDNARGQVMLAAQVAGFEVMRLIAEPTAAALAYGIGGDKIEEGSYLVYDLGGGTFDVSILTMQEGVMQVIATDGDNMLGGDDIDHLLANWMMQQGWRGDDDVLQEAKAAKERLSIENEVTVTQNAQKLSITRAQVEQIITPIINKTINIAKAAHFAASNIPLDGIILVGGGSRIPLISQKLQDIFKVKIYSHIDPDKVVAIGAAAAAANLVHKQGNLLLDVTPLSLGIELYGGIFEKIIMRNTQIPCSVKHEFTTHADNQTGMQFHVLQGERELAKDCRSLAKFELKGLAPKKAGRVKIEVIFTIDVNGILSVTARDKESGIMHNIDIKPSYGLSDDAVNEMLLHAYKNVKNDHDARLLLEAKESGNDLIRHLTKAISETPDLLPKKEEKYLNDAIKSLQDAINLDNREDIVNNIEKVNKVAVNFIERHLNYGATMHLKGKKIT